MNKPTLFSKFLHEPFFHFLLIGIGLFFLYSQLNPKDEINNEKSILITASKIEALSIAFLRERSRAPTADEMKNLLESEIREEVFYREALAMGLDREDLIIRRRLSQKMKYLFEDIAIIDTPNDAKLEEFLKQHPTLFTLAETRSFSQVYLDPKLHRNSLEKDAKNFLNHLNNTPLKDALILGDRSLLAYNFTKRRESDVIKIFGKEFASRVFNRDIHSWQGPIKSPYGIHFIYIHAQEETFLAPLNRIKSSVLQEYKRVKQLEANELFYQHLKERYEIKVDDVILKTAHVSSL